MRLLVLYDVPNWAYHYRAQAIQKYAPHDWNVEIRAWPEMRDIPQHDIVFNLDTSMPRRWSNKPHIVSWNSDRHRRTERWEKTYRSADWVLINNKCAFEFYGRRERTCCISNGVDTDIFKVVTPIEQREQRVFWTGSANPEKRKGWDILQQAEPLLRENGFVPEFHPVESHRDAPFDQAGMVEAYNRSSYVVCLSQSEGTPNTSLEGMACGCVLVTTNVGNASELSPGLRFGCRRDPEHLLLCLNVARDDRSTFSGWNSEAMKRHWSYGPPGNRAAYYFSLFRALVSGRQPDPFSYDECSPEEI